MKALGICSLNPSVAFLLDTKWVVLYKHYEMLQSQSYKVTIPEFFLCANRLRKGEEAL